MKIEQGAQIDDEMSGDEQLRFSLMSQLEDSGGLLNNLLRILKGGVIITCARYQTVQDCSKAAEHIFGYSREEMVGQSQAILYPSVETYQRSADKVLEDIQTLGQHICECQMQRKNGDVFPVEHMAIPLYGKDGELMRILIVVRDVTGRRRMEELLSRYELLAYNARDIFLFLRQETGQILDVNEAAVRTYGYSYDEFSSMKFEDLQAPGEEHITHRLRTRKTFSSGILLETVHKRKDGSLFPIEISLQGAVVEGENVLLAVIREATARKQSEEALRQEKELAESIVQTAQVIILMLDTEGRIVRYNPYMEEITGYPLEEMCGKDWFSHFLPGDQRDDVRAAFQESISGKQTRGAVTPILTRSGQRREIEWYDKTLKDKDGHVVGLLAVGQDVTDRMEKERQIQLQLKRLASLRQIDMVIAGSLSKTTTLNILLEQVVQQLEVDAASILLVDLENQTLREAARKGFRSQRIDETPFRMDDSLAYSVILERRLRYSQRVLDSTAKRAQLYHQEGFSFYCAAPLEVKGQIKGVLQVFLRESFQPSDEWLDFFETLAGQAAIAIDNAELFEGLQRKNFELMLAYEATIEGWSKAMDMRDHETEGHTQRVTEMTLRLARAMGIDESELVHIRRGALLHDIGKMAVPDHILLKPGALTDEEWAIMRQHPFHAYKMISSIQFLRHSLDIPYCHHEKWDGTGYPRGLKGEEIPFAARIFALADVWDALSSDRPYRPKWEPEAVMQYIREQSGKHFDPAVVEAFMKMMQDGDAFL